MAQTVTIVTSIAGYSFDAVFEEKHVHSIRLATHPLQNGKTVADHIIVQPKKVSITAGVANVLLHTDLEDAYGDDTGRARSAFALLTQLQESMEAFDVQTGLMFYQNMICTSLTAKQDGENPNGLVFQAELTQILWDSSEEDPLQTAADIFEQASSLAIFGYRAGKEMTGSRAKKALDSIVKMV